MIKRACLTLLPVALLFGGAMATTSSLTSAAALQCGGSGYSSGTCQSVPPGGTTTVSVPGIPTTILTIGFTNGTGSTLDISASSVATPPGAPAGSMCFSARVFNHSTGQELTGTLSNPLVFQTQYTVYGYDSSTGGFSQLGTGSSGYPESWAGGIFCIAAQSSSGVGLPETGGAA